MDEIRDSELHFEDGNIVLAAQDGPTTYFRLHKSILVKHSPVFADMFAMPQPPTTDMYDGVPLVQMPDKTKPLRDFIAFLYDPQCIAKLLIGSQFTTNILEPTLIAKKYQVNWICDMIATQLQKHWPTSLEGWDAITSDEEAEEARLNQNGWVDPSWSDATLKLRIFPEPVSSIRLARELNLLDILPFALLYLLRLSYWNTSLLPSQEDWAQMRLARERIVDWLASRRMPWHDCGTQTSRQCERVADQIWYYTALEMARNSNFLRAANATLSHDGKHHAHLKDLCPICKNEDRQLPWVNEGGVYEPPLLLFRSESLCLIFLYQNIIMHPFRATTSAFYQTTREFHPLRYLA
ncbi:hypothetical protein FB45DRAFT_821630 [Roridomyces roridus]|uniref:BTB domain-containing protein n=1 Tax=Roridomyces roridus TaxID=1738132 RepID=A0AAD7G085_9AGAR|nr:hypothetical protein FB45DRAFT_821630 [Roridomyces roridus]